MTKFGALVLLFLLAPAATAAPSKSALYGTWQLVSYTRQVVATGERTDLFGKNPRGFISYGRDGRMSVIIVKDDRPAPADLATMTDQQRADLFRTVIAYAGTYTVGKSVVTHHVQISWNQAWTGTDQARNIKFEGSRLVLSTNAQPNSVDGKVSVSVLVWEKLK